MAGETQADWLRPETISEGVSSARTDRARFELRPLSLGEVLDRTFALYRSRFWLFASISAVAAAVQVVVQALSLTTTHQLMRNVAVMGRGPSPGGANPMAVGAMLQAQAGAYFVLLIYFLVSAVTQAATSLAMSDVYLGRATGAKEALRAVLPRWYRWIGIALWQAGSFLWIPLLALLPAFALMAFGVRSGNQVLAGIGGVLAFVAVLGGFPAGFVMYLRNALAVPAAVAERLTIRPAMRRSKALAKGTKGRIFVVLLAAGCLLSVVGVLESPASLLILFAPKGEHYLAQAITLLVSFVGRAVVAPVAMIGMTLVYFDQRVRREALDLQLLLEASRGAEGTFPATPGAPAEGLPTL